ncbi:MAG: hypothetical protein ACR2MN_01700 [Acidimicrobiales bacterium]
MLILDPTGELADAVTPLEDLLRFCDADSGDDVQVLDDAAQTAGALVRHLREASSTRPTIVAPDARTELGPVLLRSQYVRRFPPTIFRGIDLVAGIDPADRRVSDAIAALRLIERCRPHDPSPAGMERDRLVAEEARRRPDDNIVVAPSPWEAAVAADETVLLGAWPDEANARWVLTVDQHAAYRRLCAALLDDALDRFATLG